jgi:hypothetical protein
MDVYDTNLTKFNENTPLSELGAAIRRYNRVLKDCMRATLRTAMDLGDALALARARVEVRGWKAWRAANCPDISKRWDELCRQLAANRAPIERVLADNPDLTVRDAIKLVSRPKERSPKAKPATLEKWRALSPDEKRAGLAADGIDLLLEHLPSEWRDELADRVERVRHKTIRDRGLSELLREHIAKNPEDQLTKHVRAKLIDPKRIMVHVAEIDAPARRRPPLVTIAARAINPVNSVH